jgi:hypothetical protein
MIDPKLARLIHTGEAPGILYGCCLDPATGHSYGGGADGHVYRLATRAGKEAKEQPPEKAPADKLWRHHDNYIAALVWHEGIAISAGYDGKLVWTKAENGEKQREVTAHQAWIRDLVLVGSDKLVTAADDMLVKLWNLKTGELIRTFDGHAKQTPEGYATALYAVAASADGKLIATADRIGVVNVWNSESGDRLAELKAITFYTFDAEKRARAIGGIRSLAFSADGKQLAIGGIGQVSNVDGFVGPCRLEIWDWQAGKRVYLGTDKHQAILNHVEYLPESKLLIGAGGGDGGPILAFWDQQTEAPVAKAKPKAHIQHFAFDPATEQLIAVGLGGFQVWAFTPVPAKEAK